MVARSALAKSMMHEHVLGFGREYISDGAGSHLTVDHSVYEYDSVASS